MRMAVGACDYERLQWVRLALAWQHLGRADTSLSTNALPPVVESLYASLPARCSRS
jgi:hypothetical protein